MFLPRKKYITTILIPAIAVILLVNYVLPQKTEKDVKEKIENALESGNNAVAKDEYKSLIEKDFFNLENHRGYISSHMKQPKRIGKREVRNDDSLFAEYNRYAQSDDARTSDIGFYGIGYFFSLEGKYEQALDEFKRVKNKDLPYLNNSMGLIYSKLGAYKPAEEHFLKEIELKGNLDGAYANLAEALYLSKDYNKLNELISRRDIRKYIPQSIIRYAEMKNMNVPDYLKDSLSAMKFNIYGFTGALLILICWFIYLKGIDVFEPEPLKYTVSALIAGMLFSYLTVPLYDFTDLAFGFRLNGSYLNDIIFCIFGIGLIEESVKIIPVLLIMKYTKAINESVDYIIYGSISALGFAFMENLLYFNDGGLISMTSRALSSVVLHMTLTSIVMYGLFYSKYKANGSRLFYFSLSFACAVVIHGLYDFILTANGLIGELTILSVFILVYCIVSYGKAINCALNFSEFMPKKNYRFIDQTERLCTFLSAIILLQYAFVAYKFGASNANKNLVWTLFTSYFLLYAIISSFGDFEIRKLKWIPIFDRSK